MQHSAKDVAETFDLASLPAGFHENPYSTYHALREHAPVKRLPTGAYFLTRYDDLAAVYRNAKSFSSDKTVEFKPKFGDSLLYEHHTTSLVFNDPPLHTRVRRLIAGALTPRAIKDIEPDLVALVDGLLDRMAGKTDLITDYAAAIPVEVIGNLLAVPHQDRGPLRDWSLAILGALEPVVTVEAFERGNGALKDFLAYLDGLIERRRANSGNPDRDVLTRLIGGESNGGRLNPQELLHNCIFLLNAGHETTTNLIGNGLVALLEHPGERDRLLANPGLAKTGVEEILRFESSNQLGNRITTEPVEIGGIAMPAGTQITLCIGAANRDPSQFSDPDKMDIERAPNRHLAFGIGIHQCAGLSVARLEGQIAISRFIARFPNYSLGGPPVRGGRVRFRGFKSVPCSLNA